MYALQCPAHYALMNVVYAHKIYLHWVLFVCCWMMDKVHISSKWTPTEISGYGPVDGLKKVNDSS